MSDSAQSYNHHTYLTLEKGQLKLAERMNTGSRAPNDPVQIEFHPNELRFIKFWPQDFAGNSEIVSIQFFASQADKKSGKSFWTYKGPQKESPQAPFEYLEAKRVGNQVMLTHKYRGTKNTTIFYGIYVNHTKCMDYLDPELVITKDTGPLHGGDD